MEDEVWGKSSRTKEMVWMDQVGTLRRDIRTKVCFGIDGGR